MLAKSNKVWIHLEGSRQAKHREHTFLRGDLVSNCTGCAPQYHKGGSVLQWTGAGGVGAAPETLPDAVCRSAPATIREGNAMLQFESKKGVEFCDGLTRRDFLRV